MRKILSLILSILMIFTLSVPTFAATNNNTIENGIEYLTIYDEVNNTVQAAQKIIATGEIVYGPTIYVGSDTYAIAGSARVIGADIHQDTFLNFEYDIWETNPREWNLERPNGIFNQYYFRVYQNASNESYLRTWKDDVDTLNAEEFAAIGLVGLAGYNIVKAAIESHAALASGGLLSAAAIKSIKDAIKSTTAAAVAVGALCSAYNNCVLSYNDVLNHTDNIHYE